MNIPELEGMVNYVIADETGTIRVSGSIPQDMLEHQQIEAGHKLVIGKGHCSTHKVVNGCIVERDSPLFNNSIDELIRQKIEAALARQMKS